MVFSLKNYIQIFVLQLLYLFCKIVFGNVFKIFFTFLF